MENMEENKEISKEINEELFFERPFEKVDGGYYDERGFYTTPNGSFWDLNGIYFNQFGFDKFGGSYDKYGIYHPGKDFLPENNLYKEEKYLIDPPELNSEDKEKINILDIQKLIDQEKNDKKILKEYYLPVEESDPLDQENISLNICLNNINIENSNIQNDNDIESNSSNNTYNSNDFQEAYNNALECENYYKSHTQSYHTDSEEFNYLSQKKEE